MPELPEVETMVRGIRPELEGRTISEMEFCPCTRKPLTVSPSARVFRNRTKNQTICRVWRFAKRVVIELKNGDSIVVEPRMTGLMLISDPPTEAHRRICWHLTPCPGQRSSFEFWDRRGLGTVRLLDRNQMQLLTRSLGPDALKIDVNDWKQRLSRTQRPIKVAMLDQKIVAGIGNLYASEILHLAAVSPLRAAASISKKRLERVVAATREILSEAIRYEGSTLSDGTYRNALNKDGGYQNEHRVYQKAGQACQSCGTLIKRIVQAQRSTFYCPRCQK